jgi:hypothetical protein
MWSCLVLEGRSCPVAVPESTTTREIIAFFARLQIGVIEKILRHCELRGRAPGSRTTGGRKREPQRAW